MTLHKLLENIHHIFSGIDNFITLLAIDRNELTQVIKTAYGTDIDTSAYLKKIIDFYVQLDFGKPASDYWDKYSDFSSRFFGSDISINWCYNVIPTLMANLDIRTQEKIWKNFSCSLERNSSFSLVFDEVVFSFNCSYIVLPKSKITS